jgi:hypothetical protein
MLLSYFLGGVGIGTQLDMGIMNPASSVNGMLATDCVHIPFAGKTAPFHEGKKICKRWLWCV